MQTLEKWKVIEDGRWGAALCGWALGLARGPLETRHFPEQRLIDSGAWGGLSSTGGSGLQMGQSQHSPHWSSVLPGCSQISDEH